MSIAGKQMHGLSLHHYSLPTGSWRDSKGSSTQFKEAACASLKAGDSVEVKGARQTDNSVLATRVERKK